MKIMLSGIDIIHVKHQIFRTTWSNLNDIAKRRQGSLCFPHQNPMTSGKFENWVLHTLHFSACYFDENEMKWIGLYFDEGSHMFLSNPATLDVYHSLWAHPGEIASQRPPVLVLRQSLDFVSWKWPIFSKHTKYKSQFHGIRLFR